MLDVIQISYHEPEADENFETGIRKFDRAYDNLLDEVGMT